MENEAPKGGKMDISGLERLKRYLEGRVKGIRRSRVGRGSSRWDEGSYDDGMADAYDLAAKWLGEQIAEIKEAELCNKD